MTKPVVTFVLLAHNEKYDFHVSLGSLMCQTNPNWKAIVFHNGINIDLRQDIFSTFIDRRITWKNSLEDNGTDTINRQQAWDKYVDTEWMVSTSIQDYYLPKTVEHIMKVQEHYDLIYWGSMNNHWVESEPLPVELTLNRIDWGNFAIRIELAKKTGMNHHRAHNSDGMFILDVLKSNPKHYKIPALLTIHN